MQLLIKIFVFIISTQNLAKFFSFENVRINHDSHILLVYKIAVTKQTTNFFFFFEIVVQTQINISIKKLRDIVFIEEKCLRNLKRKHDD
jgi:hypothetical protein